MKHTATPWILVDGDRFSKEKMITTQDRINNGFGPICEMDIEFDGFMGDEQPANAELIVRAVNSHEKLVKALERMCAWHELQATWDKGNNGYYEAKKALAAAKGE